ncbi:phage transcriptional regulator [Acidithiobacillus caldus SM-1]|uniref:Phage transcriptional regulator n=1 Tax=Acidithiobacillus caldus (strain SM-1) TaxID=990288 RepID=F9ZQI1_ACICS|nr:phage transcriptional regulator [Acidithiobacillus caldus SM-1]
MVERKIGEDTVPTVDARELHAFLGVKKVFRSWIQERIAQYGFVENQDFAVSTKFGRNHQGGRPSKEYDITLDMAKELAMVERTRKGKEARQYFIDCERELYAKQRAVPEKKDLSMAAIHSTFRHLVRMQQEFLQVDRPQALRLASAVMRDEYDIDMSRLIPGLGDTEETPSATAEPGWSISLDLVVDADLMPRIHLSTEERTLLIGRTYCALRDQRAAAIAEKNTDVGGSHLIAVAQKWKVTTATVKRAAQFVMALDRLKAVGAQGVKAAEIILRGEVADAVTVLPMILKREPDPFFSVAAGLCAGYRKIQDIVRL